MLKRSFDSQFGRYRYQLVGIVSSDRLIAWRMWSRWSLACGSVELIPVKDAYMPQSYTRAQVELKFRIKGIQMNKSQRLANAEGNYAALSAEASIVRKRAEAEIERADTLARMAFSEMMAARAECSTRIEPHVKPDPV